MEHLSLRITMVSYWLLFGYNKMNKFTFLIILGNIDLIGQWFSTFFWFAVPFLTLNNLAAPVATITRKKSSEIGGSLELFTATRLRTIALGWSFLTARTLSLRSLVQTFSTLLKYWNLKHLCFREEFQLRQSTSDLAKKYFQRLFVIICNK